MNTVYAALVGLIGGLLGGLFGVGGGVVMVPALVSLLGVSMHTAVGTSLLVIIPTACTGAFKHYQLGNLDWKIGASLVPMAMIGSYTGAWLTSHISAGNLKRAFGGFLVLVGLRLLFAKS